jgi:hypothetical protein
LSTKEQAQVNWHEVSLRLVGDLGVLEQVASAMEGLPFQLRRKGELYPQRRRPQRANVLLLGLAEWERGGVSDGDDRDAILADERAQLAAAAVIVDRLAPMLAAIDRSRAFAELWISTVREEDQGGFGLPAKLVSAAGKAGLEISLSIGVCLPNDDEDETTETGEVEAEGSLKAEGTS